MYLRELHTRVCCHAVQPLLESPSVMYIDML